VDFNAELIISLSVVGLPDLNKGKLNIVYNDKLRHQDRWLKPCTSIMQIEHYDYVFLGGFRHCVDLLGETKVLEKCAFSIFGDEVKSWCSDGFYRVAGDKTEGKGQSGWSEVEVEPD
jgi:hypothetical protein